MIAGHDEGEYQILIITKTRQESESGQLFNSVSRIVVSCGNAKQMEKLAVLVTGLARVCLSLYTGRYFLLAESYNIGHFLHSDFGLSPFKSMPPCQRSINSVDVWILGIEDSAT